MGILFCFVTSCYYLLRSQSNSYPVSICSQDNVDALSEPENVFWEGHACSEDCKQKFSKEETTQLRNDSLALDYKEKQGSNYLDITVLSAIRTMYRTENVITHARSSVTCDRQRMTCSFSVHGKVVCREFFFYVHAIKIKRWKRLLNIYKNQGQYLSLHAVYLMQIHENLVCRCY